MTIFSFIFSILQVPKEESPPRKKTKVQDTTTESVSSLQQRVLQKQLENLEKSSLCMDKFLSVMTKIESIIDERSDSFLSMLLSSDDK